MSRSAFIVSSGRTGTKFLAEFFKANYPDVLARHEPQPSYHLRMLSNAHAAGRVSSRTMASVLRLSRPELGRYRSELYLESNPFLYGFVGVLADVAESPVIIHIVRDPRSYVASAINHGGGSGLKALATALIPFWFPPVRSVPGVSGKPTPVEMFAGEWALVNQFIGQHGGSQPGYHLFKFEDIFDATNSGLRRMVELLGLAYPGTAAPISAQEKINAARLDLIGEWHTWTPDQWMAVERICGEMMQRFGYGSEPEWAD
jgi:hypothetical protein